MIYYNLILGIGSLAIIPYIKNKKVTLLLPGKDLGWSLISTFFLVVATLLLTILFEIADGVVIPNILASTRGIFIVIISAVLSHHESTLLETQTWKIYLLRLVASSLILLSIWITLNK